jgi:hypothetical protein
VELVTFSNLVSLCFVCKKQLIRRIFFSVYGWSNGSNEIIGRGEDEWIQEEWKKNAVSFHERSF